MTYRFAGPSPGSQKAVDKGCRCPILDNAYGKGRGGDGEQFGWYVNGTCPLHAKGQGDSADVQGR